MSVCRAVQWPTWSRRCGDSRQHSPLPSALPTRPTPPYPHHPSLPRPSLLGGGTQPRSRAQMTLRRHYAAVLFTFPRQSATGSYSESKHTRKHRDWTESCRFTGPGNATRPRQICWEVCCGFVCGIALLGELQAGHRKTGWEKGLSVFAPNQESPHSAECFMWCLILQPYYTVTRPH